MMSVLILLYILEQRPYSLTVIGNKVKYCHLYCCPRTEGLYHPYLPPLCFLPWPKVSWAMVTPSCSRVNHLLTEQTRINMSHMVCKCCGVVKISRHNTWPWFCAVSALVRTAQDLSLPDWSVEPVNCRVPLPFAHQAATSHNGAW